LPGVILAPLIEEAREANAAFSLARLLPQARSLQPTVILLDAAGNAPGYSRHLVGVTAMLFRRLGQASPAIDRAAETLAVLQPDNPFFQLTRGAPREEISQKTLSIAPRNAASLPESKADRAWQRDTAESAWKRSNLWDFVFIGRLLEQGGP
jgi:hypothetical protein